MKRERGTAPLVVSVALLALFTATACSGERGPPASKAEPATLFVGYTLDHPPLEYLDPDTGDLTGFDIELTQAVADDLGLKIDWREMEFGLLPSSLMRGEIDLAIAGIVDTAARQRSLTFIDYLHDELQFFTTSDRSSGDEDIVDVCGTTVVTVRATVYPDAIDTWSKDHCRPGEKVASLEFQKVSDAIGLLDRAGANAAMLGGVLLSYQRSRSPGAYTLIGEPFDTSTYGIAVDPRRAALTADIRTSLEGLLADGTYGDLLRDYSLEPYGLDEITINGAVS